MFMRIKWDYLKCLVACMANRGCSEGDSNTCCGCILLLQRISPWKMGALCCPASQPRKGCACGAQSGLMTVLTVWCGVDLILGLNVLGLSVLWLAHVVWAWREAPLSSEGKACGVVELTLPYWADSKLLGKGIWEWCSGHAGMGSTVNQPVRWNGGFFLLYILESAPHIAP